MVTVWMQLQYLDMGVSVKHAWVHEYESSPWILDLLLQLDFCFDYKGTT